MIFQDRKRGPLCDHDAIRRLIPESRHADESLSIEKKKLEN